MDPRPLDEATRRRMKRQRRRDTKLEVEIRRCLHALGFRYRVDYRLEPALSVRGDIVFTRKRVVVFVDGCFWHGCPEHASHPVNNAEWWESKIAANAARDDRATIQLEERGWTVVRVWEHEPTAEAVSRIVTACRQTECGS